MLANGFQRASERLRTDASSPVEVAIVLRRVRNLIDLSMTEIKGHFYEIDIPSEEMSGKVLTAEITRPLLHLRMLDDVDGLVSTFIRYDRYFSTRRVLRLSPEQSLLQLLATTSLVIQDIPNCMIDLNEVRCILDALICILRDERISLSVEGTNEQQNSMEFDSVTTTDEVIFRRWKTGHHLYNQLIVQVIHELDAVSKADDVDEIIRRLDRATIIFRATTAAMWFAEAFPRNKYLELVRPSMIEASRPGYGFSGTDNLEHRLFKISFKAIFDWLQELFGPKDLWPDPLRSSVLALVGARQLDLEHHTLLAEKVVELGPSLKQVKHRTASTEYATHDDSAVESLRRIGDTMRKIKDEFED